MIEYVRIQYEKVDMYKYVSQRIRKSNLFLLIDLLHKHFSENFLND